MSELNAAALWYHGPTSKGTEVWIGANKPLASRDVRNLITILELQAVWLEADEAADAFGKAEVQEPEPSP